MRRFLDNLFFRHKDPTRRWIPHPAAVSADLRLCTLCGVPLGGDFQGLQPLGRSEDARRAARGNLAWPSQGAGCFIEEVGGQHRLGDFRLIFDGFQDERPFTAPLFANAQPLHWSNTTTEADIIAALGEPFARADNDWDSAQMLFWEFDTGEVQIALNPDTLTLDMIECWFEPELAQEGALKTYGIPQEFPPQFRRKLTP